MACPTCDHTMQGLGESYWWCPRCGTIRAKDSDDVDEVPSLPLRVRTVLPGLSPETEREFWVAGIYEACLVLPLPPQSIRDDAMLDAAQ